MIKVLKRIRNSFLNLGIRNKILLSFFALIITPILIIVASSYGVSSNIIEQKTARYSHDILFQTKNTMEIHLKQIEDISFNIFIDSKFQDVMLKAVNSGLDEYEESRATTEINNILASQGLYHNEIDAIFIVSHGGYVYELDKTKQNYGLLQEYSKDIMDKKGSSTWLGGLKGQNIVALAREINSVKTQKSIGYLVIYLDKNYFNKVLSDTRTIMGGDIYIVDRNGTIIIGSVEDRIGTISEAINNIQIPEDYSFTTQVIHETTQYVALSEPMSNGWRIVTTVPVSVYRKEITNLRDTIILVAIIILALSVFVAWRLSIGISNPIKKLTNSMNKFGQGKLSVRCPEDTSDEVGQCAAAFNHMAENINFLVNKVYEEQLMKREAELKSLQMQINPHFLYNTLDTINWMARTQGNPDVGIMAKALGDLMRATINGKDYVLLEEEIASLNNYLMIQKYRYGNKIETKINIAENTGKLYVPKLIIQPLVENAIYHGIEPTLEKGIISITATLDGGDLLIEVSDNGIGMSKEKIKELLSSGNAIRDSQEYSIGVKNVIKRIKTLFGDDYGILIQSEFGEGSIITIRIPSIEEINDIKL